MDYVMSRDGEANLTLSNVMARVGVILLAAVLVSAAAGALGGERPVTPVAAVAATDSAANAQVAALRAELAAAQGRLTVERMKNRRAEAVQGYSAHYRIHADLSA